MKKLFIETSGFTNRVIKLLTEDDYTKLQKQLLDDPDCGGVMPGCGGLRKIRLPDPKRKKGKRGGLRLIYLHVPEANWIFLLHIYDKNEQDDLNVKQKKILKNLVKQCKEEALRKTSPGRKMP